MTEFEDKLKTAKSTEEMRKARLENPEAFEKYRTAEPKQQEQAKVQKSRDHKEFDNIVDDIVRTRKVTKHRAMQMARVEHNALFRKAFGR